MFWFRNKKINFWYALLTKVLNSSVNGTLVTHFMYISKIFAETNVYQGSIKTLFIQICVLADFQNLPVAIFSKHN